MKILIADSNKIPAVKYGGTERVIWGLGKALVSLGHTVYYLVAKGSSCPFASEVFFYDPNKSLDKQIPDYIDVVHLNFQPSGPLNKPYITTFHGNINSAVSFDRNTVFISGNQAKRYHGSTYVYNGLDWSNYPKPALTASRNYFHFLGDASWKVKNVKGAIAITKKADQRLVVIGGTRLNLNMGFRFTPDIHVRFKGSVDDAAKGKLMSASKGLLFPVLWHEPFGLAIIESLYFGCPVFGTTYGSLPELVTGDVGFLSNSVTALANALTNTTGFSAAHCHEYAASQFNSSVMAEAYLQLYEKVLNGEQLHANNPFLPEHEISTVKRFQMEA